MYSKTNCQNFFSKRDSIAIFMLNALKDLLRNCYFFAAKFQEERKSRLFISPLKTASYFYRMRLNFFAGDIFFVLST